MNYLVANNANSLRKGCVWWCLWILNQSSWSFPSTCASTLSTYTSSAPRATIGTVECHRAKVDRDRWVPGRTIATTSTASRILLLQLLGNTTSRIHRVDDPLEANHWLRVIDSKFGLLNYSEFQKKHNSSMVPQVHGGPRIRPLLRTITKCHGMRFAKHSAGTTFQRELCTATCRNS
jgi:hypothetical protein